MPSLDAEQSSESTQVETSKPDVEGMAIGEGSLISDRPSLSVSTTSKTASTAEQTKLLEDQERILKTTGQDTGPQHQSVSASTKSIGNMLTCAVEGLTVSGSGDHEKGKKR